MSGRDKVIDLLLRIPHSIAWVAAKLYLVGNLVWLAMVVGWNEGLGKSGDSSQ